MKSRLTTIIIVTLVILVNIYFVYNRYIFQKEANAKIDELENFYASKIKVIDELRKLEITYEYSPISKSAKVQLPNNERLPLKSLMKGSNKLFFCIPEGVCNMCYDSLYATFNKMAEDIGSDNIAILVPSNRLREMTLLFEGQKLSDRIFGVSSEELGLNIQGSYLPYLFIMDSTMTCRNLHLPHKNEQAITNYYLASIIKRHFPSINKELAIN